jgi:predicted lipoprotein with Yx(FWY)xxD motif
MQRLTIAALVAAVAALALAATSTAAGHAARLKTHKSPKGTVLVDGKGRTLYLFRKDKTDKSRCSGQCAADWPPLLTTGRPKVSGLVRKSLLGTTKRDDGKTQVTYNGHPLYLYSADQKPGDTNGQGLNAFGAAWFALSSAGNRVSGTGTNPNPGLGY